MKCHKMMLSKQKSAIAEGTIKNKTINQIHHNKGNSKVIQMISTRRKSLDMTYL
jgi:hypothetical protein